MKFSSSQLEIFLISQGELPKPQKIKFLIFSKKGYEQIFLETLLNNSFHLFYKLNQTILLVYKNIESFLLY